MAHPVMRWKVGSGKRQKMGVWGKEEGKAESRASRVGVHAQNEGPGKAGAPSGRRLWNRPRGEAPVGALCVG